MMSTPETAHAKMTAICNAIAQTDGWFSEIAKRNGVTLEVVMGIVFGEVKDLCRECVGSGVKEGSSGDPCKLCKGRGC